MNKATVALTVTCTILMFTLIVGTLNFFCLLKVTQAEDRIYLIKLVQNEPVSNDFKELLYEGIAADRCFLKNEANNLLFKFTLQSKINSTIIKIDDATNMYLRKQHFDNGNEFNCPH